MASILNELAIKRLRREKSLLQTEWAFQRAQENGILVLGRRGMGIKLCGLLIQRKEAGIGCSMDTKSSCDPL